MISFRRRGAALLDKVVKTFEKAIADIDQAIGDMNLQQTALNAEMEEIELAYERAVHENDIQYGVVAAAQRRALIVRANIAKLVGAE